MSFYLSWVSHWFCWVRSWCYWVNLVSFYLSWASSDCLRVSYCWVSSYFPWVKTLFSWVSFYFYFVSSSHWLLNSIKSSFRYPNFFSIYNFSLANCSNCFACFPNSIWNCLCSCSVFYFIFNSCSAIEIDASSLVVLAIPVNPRLCISFGLDTVLPVRRGLSSSSLEDLNRVPGFSDSSLGLKTLPVFLYCYFLRAVIWAYFSQMFFSNYWIFIVLA